MGSIPVRLGRLFCAKFHLSLCHRCEKKTKKVRRLSTINAGSFPAGHPADNNTEGRPILFTACNRMQLIVTSQMIIVVIHHVA